MMSICTIPRDCVHMCGIYICVLRIASKYPAPGTACFLHATSRTENTTSSSSKAAHTHQSNTSSICVYIDFRIFTKVHFHDEHQKCTPSNINSDAMPTWMWMYTQIHSHSFVRATTRKQPSQSRN